MANELFNLGEEFITKNSWQNTDVTFGLYDESTDSLGDTADVSDISTEPSDGNYQRQTGTVESADVKKINGNWGWELVVTFDVIDTTGDVDAAFVLTSFQAEETGDTQENEHLLAAAFLTQTRTLEDYDEIEITFQLPID